MRDVLWIFRKDLRSLWPRILPVLAMAAIEGVDTASTPEDPLQPGLKAVWIMMCVFLAASLVFEERLPGHEQYWLTRPFSRTRLLLAKVLFLVVFVGLPRLAAQAVSLLVNHVPLLPHVGWLFFSGLVFGMAVALIAAAVAAVTESLVQFLWVAIAMSGLVAAGMILAPPGDGWWGNLEWVRTAALEAIVSAAAIGVLVMQYEWRRTPASRGLLAGALVLAAGAPLLGSWHWAFATQAAGDRAALTIEFDPARTRAEGFSSAVQGREIALPFRPSALPAGADLLVERVNATIQPADGAAWHSGWSPVGSGNIDGWIHMVVPEAVYRAIKDSPVHVQADVALTLLGDLRRVQIKVQGRTWRIPGDGVCGVHATLLPSVQWASCAWPSRAPARAEVIGSVFGPPASYGPIAVNGALWQHAYAGFSTTPGLVEAPVELRQALAHFERELDIPAIRLRGYALRRITDPQ